jgi:3-methyladenine DNA glycosylase AlkC
MKPVSIEWIHQQLGSLYMANVQLNEEVQRLNGELLKAQMPKGKKVTKKNEDNKDQRSSTDKGAGSEN